ncbi:MAG: hypothetical protein M3Q79_03565 [bacterium]|nr:hypothetical protein [bacterium]
MSEAIKRKIENLALSEPIQLGSVDFTVNNPELLMRQLGPVFSYFGRVEHEVSTDPLTTMMPRLGTEYKGYKSHGTDFLDIWVPQEKAHGDIFDGLQMEIGQKPADYDASVSRRDRLVGAMGRLSSSVHGVFEMLYLARGAMHERLTFQGCDLMADKFKTLGEEALLQTMILPIRVQEAMHLGYYRAAAKELKQHLEPWQLWLARKLSLATYAPVGAESEADKPDFGEVASTLAGDKIDDFSNPIQAIAQDLLNSEGSKILPKFVLKAITSCVDAQSEHNRRSLKLAA